MYCKSTMLTVALLLASGAVAAQQPEAIPSRYGVTAKVDLYPQSTPQKTLTSILAAYDKGRTEYLLAHLVDPAWVDQRVKQVHAGEFDALVKEVNTKLRDNPAEAKELHKFLKDGVWENSENVAAAKLKDGDKQIFFKKVGTRWFMENRQKPEKPA